MRRLAHWLLNALTVLSLLLCVASGAGWVVSYTRARPLVDWGNYSLVAADRGRFRVGHATQRIIRVVGNASLTSRGWGRFGFEVDRTTFSTGDTAQNVYVPLWALTLLLAVLPARAAHGLQRDRRIERRERGRRCVACDYDLTGNVSGVCPECGSAIAMPEASHA